jgi:hypothetical protein
MPDYFREQAGDPAAAWKKSSPTFGTGCAKMKTPCARSFEAEWDFL